MTADSSLSMDELLSATRGQLVNVESYGPVSVELFSTDSRCIRPGGVFFALRGDRLDGHSFVAEAVAKGARLAVVASKRASEFAGLPLLAVDDPLRAYQAIAAHWRSRHSAQVIGITGSVGKTSAKELLATVLSRRYKVLATEGNLNNEIGLPSMLLRLRPEHEWAVLEMGGAYRMGEIAELAALARPLIGAVTNVSVVHLERMGSLENIARNKGELIQSLPAQGLAILNADDPRVAAMAHISKARCVTFGASPQAQYRVLWERSLGLQGTLVSIEGPGLRLERVAMPHLGSHVGHLAALAAAVACEVGITSSELSEGLMDPRSVVRCKVLTTRAGWTVIDDSYNSSPMSALSALSVLGNAPGRKIAVLGDMLELGAYERKGHEEVGSAAARVADILITVGQLGRIMAEASLRAGHSATYAVEDHKEAAQLLVRTVRPGDVILVKASHAVGLSALVSVLVDVGND